MKKNYVNKSVKISIAISVLLIGLSVTYYLMVYIPKKDKIKYETQKVEDLIESERKCRDDGTKLYKEDVKKFESYNLYAFDPEYKYKKDSHKCYYSGGGFLSPNIWERYIVDVATNKKIETIYINLDTLDDTKQTESINSFWDAHNLIFE
jgi:hypothetical protein